MSQACNFIKKEILAQVFSCEFCGFSKNSFFTEHVRTTTSENDVRNNCSCFLELVHGSYVFGYLFSKARLEKYLWLSFYLI